jgi:polyisoprenoid-binding protein YceI
MRRLTTAFIVPLLILAGCYNAKDSGTNPPAGNPMAQGPGGGAGMGTGDMKAKMGGMMGKRGGGMMGKMGGMMGKMGGGWPKEIPADHRIQFVGTKKDGKHDGGFKDFTAKLDPPKGDLGKSKLTIDIDTSSIYTDTFQLTGHLKSPDFFEVAKYPKATFVTQSIKPGKDKNDPYLITGDLTLHGKTKSVSFPAKVTETPDEVKIDGTFNIDRSDFGMNYQPERVNNVVEVKANLKIPRK